MMKQTYRIPEIFVLSFSANELLTDLLRVSGAGDGDLLNWSDFDGQ